MKGEKMGITIWSKNCEADCGYGGLIRLRQKVADLTSPEIGTLYRKQDDVPLFEPGRTEFFEQYVKDLQALKAKLKKEPKKLRILDFLYQSDCEGKAGVWTCRAIWEVIKDYDDNFCYGYAGRPDCMMWSDFKKIIQDCIETKTPMHWG